MPLFGVIVAVVLVLFFIILAVANDPVAEPEEDAIEVPDSVPEEVTQDSALTVQVDSDNKPEKRQTVEKPKVRETAGGDKANQGEQKMMQKGNTQNSTQIYETISIYFEQDTTKIKSVYYRDMLRVAKLMKEDNRFNAVVVGYNDSSDGAEIVKQRVDAIVDILVNTYKIDRNRIKSEMKKPKESDERDLVNRGCNVVLER